MVGCLAFGFWFSYFLLLWLIWYECLVDSGLLDCWVDLRDYLWVCFVLVDGLCGLYFCLGLVLLWVCFGSDCLLAFVRVWLRCFSCFRVASLCCFAF